ncbi:MAG TPA: SpoIIE family protein phosphatase [Hyphomicrobiaceae bacterium]|nr:SpoIIE family protein phosphatase [Hyphomicrobiaceae bacterium]
MSNYEFARATTQGARNYQEDTAAVWPGEGADPLTPAPPAAERHDGSIVAVLADGMGGHAGGALASRMVCEHFLDACVSRNGPVPDRLIEALRVANSAVARKVAQNPMLSGMGSTLVGARFGDEGVEWVSVGDSPLLLYRGGEIALLNEDHSLAPELDRLVAAGRMSEEEARHDPRRHMLRSAVTGDEIDMVDVSRCPLKLEMGDYVILASDGVHTLETAEIARLISAYASEGAQAVAKALIREVELLREPHQDNATVIAVRLKPPA